jgi:predicted porin
MKTTLAALMAGASLVVAGNVAAQQSEVALYGRLNLTVDGVDTRDATSQAPVDRPTQLTPSRYTGRNEGTVLRVTSNGSLLGVRGTEALGNGLRAVWQIESSVTADTGGGTIAGRNTFVGLDGPYGRIFAGNYDTPYKYITIPFGAFLAPTSFDYFGILGNPGFAVPDTATISAPTNGPADAAFDRRQGNSVQYWTPTWKGLQARVDWATGELATRKNAYVWSASVTYENGPFAAKYAYESHKDYFGLAQLGGAPFGEGNSSSRDQGHKLVLEYQIGTTKLRGAFERLDYRNDDSVNGRVDQYKRNAWWVQVEQGLGTGTLVAAYGKASDGSCSLVGGSGCRTGGLGAHQAGIGYLYPLSKRTALFAYYTQINNDESGQYMIIQPFNTSPGITTHFYSVGMNHVF